MRLEVSGLASAVADFLGSLRSEAPPQARIDSVEIEELPPIPVQALAGTVSKFALLPVVPNRRVMPCRGRPFRPIWPPVTPVVKRSQTRTSGDIAIRSQIARIAARGGRSSANCRTIGREPRWPGFHYVRHARPSMTTRPTAAFTPSRLLARSVGRTCVWWMPAAGSRRSATKRCRRPPTPLSPARSWPCRDWAAFSFSCDATAAAAVDRLRRRKHRPDRPFALMFPTLDAVRRCCLVSEDEARELLSPAAPILLLRRLAGWHVPEPTMSTWSAQGRATLVPSIAANVAPGNPYLGVMLPYTPLHHLLMDAVARPVVCTSGNLSEEPMAIDIDDALHRLGGLGERTGMTIADLLLVHDRPIVRPVDDSVARIGPDGLQVLRRARGFAPLPIKLNFAAPRSWPSAGI